MRKLILALALVLATLGASAFVTDTISVPAKNLESPMQVTVIVPDSKAASVPVVWLLNGYGGDYTSWGKVRPDLGQLADRYGMMMVMPSGMDSWYWDSPVNPKMQMETFFTTELVPYIRAKYPQASPRADLNAITGLSMGGHGAFWLATRHPDLWGNMGSTSGGVNILPFPEKWKMAKALGPMDQNPQRWREHTVINLVPQIKANGQNIIFDCGSEDFFHGVNADLHKALLDAKVPHDYISRPGNHSGKYWNNSIQYQLLFFDNCFRKAQKQ